MELGALANPGVEWGKAVRLLPEDRFGVRLTSSPPVNLQHFSLNGRLFIPALGRIVFP